MSIIGASPALRGIRNVFGIDVKDPSLALYLPLWYTHPNMAGTTLTSYDLNHHSCTVTGATWGSQGRTFDGSDDDISCGQPAVLNFGTSDCTFIVWLKNTGGDGTIESILSKCEADFDGIYMYISVTGKVTMRLRDTGAGGEEPAMTTDIGADSKWHHICYSLDRDGNMLGILDGTTESTTDISGVGSITAVANLLIGEGNLAAELNNFNGLIGEVSIYVGKALSLASAQHHRHATIWRYS